MRKRKSLSPGSLSQDYWLRCSALTVFFAVLVTAQLLQGVESRMCGATLSNWEHGLTAAIASDGDLIVFGDGTYLVVADNSGGNRLRKLGEVDLNGLFWGLDLVGDTAYVPLLGDPGVLVIVDLQNQDQPRVISRTILSQASLFEVVVRDNIAFVSGRGAVFFLDVSDPWQPTELGRFELPVPPLFRDDAVYSIALDGNIAYLAATEMGVFILDISDLAHPQDLGRFEPGTYVEYAAVEYPFLFLAEGQGPGFRVVDVSEPAVPATVATVEFDHHWAEAVKIVHIGRKHYALVSAGHDGLRLVDISRPHAPMEIAASVSSCGSTLLADMSGSRVVTANYSCVQELRGKNLLLEGAPKQLDTLGWTDAVGMDSSNHLFSVGFGHAPLILFDISDPTVPRQTGLLRFPHGEIRDIEVDGDLGFLADCSYSGVSTTNSIRIVRLLPKPVLISTLQMPSRVPRIAVSNGYIYAAMKEGGLRIIDARIPGNPETVANLDEFIDDVATDGNLLLGASDNEIIIADVSIPENPVILNRYSPPSVQPRFRAVVISGSYGYFLMIDFIHLRDYLGILDLSDPTNPQMLSKTALHDTSSASPRWLKIIDGIAFMGSSQPRVDVSDPNNPVNLGDVQFGGNQFIEPAVAEGLLAWARNWWGFNITDISNCSRRGLRKQDDNSHPDSFCPR